MSRLTVFLGVVGVFRLLTLFFGALALSLTVSLMPLFTSAPEEIPKPLEGPLLYFYVPCGYVIGIVPFIISIAWLLAYVCGVIKYESPSVTMTDSIYHMVCAIVLVLVGVVWMSIMLYAYGELGGTGGAEKDFLKNFWLMTVLSTSADAVTHFVTGILLCRVSRQPPAPAPEPVVPAPPPGQVAPPLGYYYFPLPPQHYNYSNQPPAPSYVQGQGYFIPPPATAAANLQNQPEQQSPPEQRQQQQ